MSAKILQFDLETAPAISYTWGRWKQNIGANQVVQEGYILCWTAKFYGEEEIYQDALINYKTAFKKDPTDDRRVVASLANLMEEADIILAYNGDGFDVKWVNAQLARHRLPPMAPQKTIDPLKWCKRQFRFPSNRMDEVAKYLKIDQRKNEMTFEDWIGCMRGEQESWTKMLDYNEQDIYVMEEVYSVLRPYVKGHPNLVMYEEFPGDAQNRCPKCGSGILVKNGYYVTNISKFRRFLCKGCGNRQIRGGKNLWTTDERREVVRPGAA